MKKSKLIGIALLSMLLLMPMQTVSANDYFSLNSTNNTWTGAQKKNDWANAVVNLQSGLGLPWSSARCDDRSILWRSKRECYSSDYCNKQRLL